MARGSLRLRLGKVASLSKAMKSPLPETPYAAPRANPYAPPADPQGSPAAPEEPLLAPLSAALYTPNQVALATFLGTPLGGAAVMAINEHRLGRKSGVVKTMLLGLVGTIALLGIGFVLPDNFPSFPIAIGNIMAMRVVAQRRHGELVHRHCAAGGQRASSWGAAGIGILALATVLVPVVGVVVVMEAMAGH